MPLGATQNVKRTCEVAHPSEAPWKCKLHTPSLMSSCKLQSSTVFIKADQIHQNPWKSIKHGSTGSPKQVPKTASIECCARPLVPQVMKVCFILVLGHRYETCTLVFYRGVFKKKTVAQSALMPHYSIEKMVSKKTCAPPFYRGCFAGGTCTPTIYIYKMGGHQCTPWIHRGISYMYS